MQSTDLKLLLVVHVHVLSRLILGLRPANGRRRYKVTPSRTTKPRISLYYGCIAAVADRKAQYEGHSELLGEVVEMGPGFSLTPSMIEGELQCAPYHIMSQLIMLDSIVPWINDGQKWNFKAVLEIMISTVCMDDVLKIYLSV